MVGWVLHGHKELFLDFLSSVSVWSQISLGMSLGEYIVHFLLLAESFLVKTEFLSAYMAIKFFV